MILLYQVIFDLCTYSYICDQIWENPPYARFFVKIEFGVHDCIFDISYTIEPTICQV